MSQSTEPAARNLVVETRTPGAEIYVINAAGEVVAKAVTRLQAALSPGLYKLRYRVGDRVTDQLIELPEGEEGEEDFRVEGPRLPFETPAPIARLGETLPEGAEIARRLSLSPPIRHGAGSMLLLFVDARQAAGTPVRLELRDFGGVLLKNLAEADPELPSGYFGCHIELDPGPYLIRAEDVEQTVVTAAGWQTQVFIPLIEEPNGWHPDLTRSAMLMPRIGHGFEPSMPNLRWTEVAREALAARRAAAASDPELMPFMLSEKFDDPMLGILAAHLLLLPKEPDRVLLSELARNLERLVPDHPDVRALLFDAGDPRAAEAVFAEPPMLRSSWSRILRHSRPGGDPFVPQSYASRVGGTLWGAGAWLNWKTPPKTSSIKSADAETDLQRFFRSLRAGRVPAEAVLREDLSPAERVLLYYAEGSRDQLNVAKRFTETVDGSRWFSWVAPAWRLARPSEFEKNARESVREALDTNHLAANTGIPINALADAAASMTEKFGERRGTFQLGNAISGTSQALGNAISGTSQALGHLLKRD